MQHDSLRQISRSLPPWRGRHITHPSARGEATRRFRPEPWCPEPWCPLFCRCLIDSQKGRVAVALMSKRERNEDAGVGAAHQAMPCAPSRVSAHDMPCMCTRTVLRIHSMRPAAANPA
eukprot:363998-Chlamydomonas_euryale.AAC.1